MTPSVWTLLFPSENLYYLVVGVKVYKTYSPFLYSLSKRMTVKTFHSLRFSKNMGEYPV